MRSTSLVGLSQQFHQGLLVELSTLQPSPSLPLAPVLVSLKRRSQPVGPARYIPVDAGGVIHVQSPHVSASTPNPSDSYYYRAISYTSLGNDVEARQDVERAVELGIDRAELEAAMEDAKRQR